MAMYYVPTKKEFSKNPNMKGMSWDHFYAGKEYICDTCHKQIGEGEGYVITDVKDGKITTRHVLCDEGIGQV